MKKEFLALVLSLISGFSLWVCPIPLSAQTGGDQILDGIGETALIARYVFDGSLEDRGRNHIHAALLAGNPAYSEEGTFGKVLSLPGGALQIPGRALVAADSLSIAGWVNLQSAAPGQIFFDFGLDAGHHVYCRLTGPDGTAGFHVGITAGGLEVEQGFTGRAFPVGRWLHVTVVLDASRRTLTGYVMGRTAGQVENLNVRLEQILNRKDPAANLLYLGRAQDAKAPNLQAKLHDVRLYSIALGEEQVEAIIFGALGDSARGPRRIPETAAPLVRSLALGLVAVPDIAVETEAGTLPRLPVRIPGVYENGAAGPLVRVIWPSPADNADVRNPGTYTLTGIIPGTAFQPKAVVTVKPVQKPDARTNPKRVLEPFPLGQVVLNRDESGRDTPFIKNRDKFISTLAKVNPDNFLYNFRDAFGQPQPEGVVQLGGWDDQTTRLRGHATGHYLSAIAQAYAGSAYDSAVQAGFRQKMNYLIDTLYDLSRKSGRPTKTGGPYTANPTAVPPGPGKSGYDSDLTKEGLRHDYWNWGIGFISAYPPDQFIMLEKGATYGGTNAQIWAPYYTLHKILAGLLDCYEVGGNPKALEIAEGMGTWALKRLQAVPAETLISMWSTYIAGEYGGMNEVMARLYRITRKPEYLACAKLFDNTNFFFGNAEHQHGLAKNVDTLHGRHANQHIPQITGALETYKGTDAPEYFVLADHFWNIARDHYMYAIGGVAGARNPRNSECFTVQPDSLFANGFSPDGQNETCATYNLLKLSRQLFFYEVDPKFMDYYEQGLYNHILASVAETNAGNTYHVPLNPGARKSFDNENMDGFTCCNGTALESNTKLQDSIYFKSLDNRELYVNLYVPSSVTWTERGVVLTQSTNFPYADSTKLTISGSGRFVLKVRVPVWATKGFFVAINGRDEKAGAKPGTYLALLRDWKDGDTISLRMPFSFRLDAVMDQPNVASIFYGPVLLAVQEEGPLSSWRAVTLDAKDISKSISGDPATLRFTLNGLTLKPFFESYGNYSVYLDVTLQ
ncbi:MAG: beta-L-arabinofuranosidase domain-containing protein [Candidatus Aminicenantales bacterium]